jgi:hypothetical protein
MLDSGSNMEMFQLIVGIILIIGVKLLVWRFIFDRIRVARLTEEGLKFDKIRSVYKDLKKNKIPKNKTIKKYANNTEKRTLVFELLYKFDRADLFPKELLTREKASESHLVNWLNQHDEYDHFPDKIKYCEQEELKDQFMVFKFKSDEPHEFADKGWVYGYVGYQLGNDVPYAQPDFIMSAFEHSILTLGELQAELG